MGHAKCDNNGSIVCDKGWYNVPKCDKFCVARNDSIDGFYTCSKRGTQVCRANWYNPPACKTFCAPLNDTNLGQFTCTKNGSRLCFENWTGKFCNISRTIGETHSVMSTKSSQVFSSLLKRVSMIYTSSFSTSQLSATIDINATYSSFKRNSEILTRKTKFAGKTTSNADTKDVETSVTFASFTQRTILKTSLISNFIFATSLRSSVKDKTSATSRLWSSMTQPTPRLEISQSTASLNNFQKTSLKPRSNIPASISPTISNSVATISVQRNDSYIPTSKGSKITEELEWLLKTSRGNMALIGFAAAFFFFILFIIALCKIYRYVIFGKDPG